MVSPISNFKSTFFLTDICYDFLFFSCIWQTEKKNMFRTNKKSGFFFNCSNWEKLVEKLLNQIGENVWVPWHISQQLNKNNFRKSKNILHRWKFIDLYFFCIFYFSGKILPLDTNEDSVSGTGRFAKDVQVCEDLLNRWQFEVITSFGPVYPPHKTRIFSTITAIWSYIG